jgi:hypothetical protein
LKTFDLHGLRSWPGQRHGIFEGRSRTIGRFAYRLIYGREILKLMGVEGDAPAAERVPNRRPARPKKESIDYLRSKEFHI